MKTPILATLTIALVMALALAATACDDNTDTHTHEWEWVVTEQATATADGLETETCKTCGATNGTRPIAKLQLETKTFPITFKDGALVFTVEYKAYPTDAEPAYLTYLQTRLGVVVNSINVSSIDAVDYLLSKGNSFKITIEYAEPMYTGMDWDTTLQSFKIHNDWISTATGTDLSAVLVRDLFNAVEAE